MMDACGRNELVTRWRSLRSELDAADVHLLAVSKYATLAAVDALVAVGQRDFAESRPQQLRDRAERYPEINWHMIGPLQSNKAKYVARYAAMWHSLEDIVTAQRVARYVVGRTLPVLLQVNMAGVAHQHGVRPQEAGELLRAVLDLRQLEVVGLMCMAPRGGDAGAVFSGLRGLRDALLGGSLRNHPRMPGSLRLCMGMSGDYRQAVAEGADMVRIGSGLFGARTQG